jgi:DNA-binding response OmpR family regulator
MQTQRLLLIDDDEFVRDLVQEILREPYELHVAATGEEGLEVLSQIAPRLVLLDIDLGEGMSGFDVCRAIRSQKSPPFVVFLTNHGSPDFVKEGLSLGAIAYLCKPFSALELLALLKTTLGEAS